MLWVGLTGPMACGKSTAAKYWSTHSGVRLIDADSLARRPFESDSEIFKLMIQRWGDYILLNSEVIDRKKVGQIIFSNNDEKKWLEGHIHPFVRKEALRFKKLYQNDSTVRVVFYDIPLLFETQTQNEFDLIVLIACSHSSQMIRAKNRDNLGAVEIQNRINNQMPLRDKIEKSHYVIWNEDGQSLEFFYKSLDRCLNWLYAQSSQTDL